MFFFLLCFSRKNPLRKVCLLRDNHRAYFYLPNPKDPEVKLQECPGNLLVAQDEDPASSRYCASIEFESRSMGSFNQLVMFDFGSMPMVVREIVVSFFSYFILLQWLVGFFVFTALSLEMENFCINLVYSSHLAPYCCCDFFKRLRHFFLFFFYKRLTLVPKRCKHQKHKMKYNLDQPCNPTAKLSNLLTSWRQKNPSPRNYWRSTKFQHCSVEIMAAGTTQSG